MRRGSNWTLLYCLFLSLNALLSAWCDKLRSELEHVVDEPDFLILIVVVRDSVAVAWTGDEDCRNASAAIALRLGSSTRKSTTAS